jgi:hypothetical protein
MTCVATPLRQNPFWKGTPPTSLTRQAGCVDCCMDDVVAQKGSAPTCTTQLGAQRPTAIFRSQHKPPISALNLDVHGALQCNYMSVL